MAKQSIEKIPPQNLEAEKSVLGSLSINKDAIIKIADIIKPDDFYKDIHGIIFEAMLELYEKREPIDVVSLSNLLSEKGKLEIIGGRSYLASLANTVPSSSHVVNYAQIVQKKATLRRLLNVAADITSLGYEETEKIEILLDKAEQQIFGVSQKYLKQNFIPIKTVLTDAFDRIDELHRESGKMRGIPTGYSELDGILAGLQKSDLVVLAARPSLGKTTLALDIARNVAINSRVTVGIFSLEMSKEQLVDRLLCSQAGVDLWKMRTGRLSEDEDFTNIGHAMGILSEAPIFIDDSATANVMEIRTKARRLQSEHNLGLIVLDYLQLMQGEYSRDNRVQEISEITRALKAIARELNIPVLAISQLSRAVESRTPPIPKLADLRESGSIEQDADVVMFIYRESMYKKDLDPVRKNIAEIHIAKHRNGPTGQIQLFFDENKVSFKNLERRTSEEPAF
ncbi:replicative DNA helicase [Patescibacteria group bacterium]|nr:replicative DNA helicase [Patescibacteria group bacterium]MBU0964232.1 replicative DNA helicase [Patescibacteria group bacterium]